MSAISTEGLHELVHDLSAVSGLSDDRFKKVVGKGSLNIKNDWRRRWMGHSHIPTLPFAIGYDLFGLAGSEVASEIGPDKGKNQGPLGNLIEFGSENNAPIPGGLPALRTEEPRFVQAIADAAEKLLAGDG